MTGDPVTISKASHLIAIRYGKNVSQGIMEMEKKIVEQNNKCNSLIDDLEFMMDDGIHYTDYSGNTISLPVERWNEIVAELRASVGVKND